MIKKIIMPAGGQTTDESLVAEWLVKPGDKVKRGDILLNIETDKTVLEVESFANGILIDILVDEGEYASAGDVLALIGDENDMAQYLRETTQAAKSPDTIPPKEDGEDEEDDDEDEYRPIIPKQIQSSKDTAPTPAPAESLSAKAMPNAKKYAKENGIDIQAFAKEHQLDVVKLKDLENLCRSVPSFAPDTDSGLLYKDIPHSNMRRVIARRMLESSQNIPSYQITVEINMSALIELRALINRIQSEVKVSYNHIIMKAICTAIRKFPNINAAWTDSYIRQYTNVNVGLAVSVDNGLVVPVVEKAEQKGILQIAAETADKITRARAGKLTPDELTGGTITLSNMGMYPVQSFSAIINPPEVCILALGSIQDRYIINDGNAVIAPVMSVTASFDHRVIDGAYGAQFLTELKQLLETPALLSC